MKIIKKGGKVCLKDWTLESLDENELKKHILRVAQEAVDVASDETKIRFPFFSSFNDSRPPLEIEFEFPLVADEDDEGVVFGFDIGELIYDEIDGKINCGMIERDGVQEICKAIDELSEKIKKRFL